MRRIIPVTILIVVSSGLLAGWLGGQAGGIYGYICTTHPRSDPPVREFLTSCGMQAGAFLGIVAGLAFSRRLLRLMRDAGGAVPRSQVRAAGARLGAFTGLLAAIAVHGTLWMAAGFAASRKPSSATVHLVVPGVLCGLLAGATLGLFGGYVLSRWVASDGQAPGSAGSMPRVLAVRLRQAIPISGFVALLAAAAGILFGGLAASGYQMYHEMAAHAAMNRRPDLVAAGTGGQWVDAVSDLPFLAPVGHAVGLGSGLLVAAIWLWAMLVRSSALRPARTLLLGSLLGVLAGISSTWLLHQALAAVVWYDVSRLWPGGSQFGAGLYFGIPAGAVVGVAGGGLLVLAGMQTAAGPRQGTQDREKGPAGAATQAVAGASGGR